MYPHRQSRRQYHSRWDNHGTSGGRHAERTASRVSVSSAAQDEQWAKFEASSADPIAFRSIPFPNKRTLAIDAKNKEQYKKVYPPIGMLHACWCTHCAWQLALRWHPDKFQQRYGARLAPVEHERIMTKVKETFQIINSARQG